MQGYGDFMIYETGRYKNDIKVKMSDVFSLADTLQSGQTFRWKPYKDGFRGIVGDKICYVSQNEDVVTFHDTDSDVFDGFWRDYFALDTDYASVRNALSYDENVSKALEYCSGIRIMHQPLWETTISFIISANNNIPRISGIIEKLSAKFGTRLDYGDEELYAFPTPEQLCRADTEDIHSCGAGYRDIYIKKTAEAFASGEFDTDKLYSLPYKEAKKYMMTLYGVGAKVADCILLFSVGMEEAFPVDVWVRKVICGLYMGIDDAKTVPVKKIEKFAEEHFPKYAGYAQQVLFYYMRNCG